MSTQREITALHAGGMSYAAIGRAVGVNDSYIRQVALGAKPGTKYEGALAAFRQSGQPAPKRGEAPRVTVAPRTTKAGDVARVRQGKVPFTLANGKHGFTKQSASGRGIVEAAWDAPRGSRVRLRVEFREVQRYAKSGGKGLDNNEVDLFGKDGWDSAAFTSAVLSGNGDVREWVQGYVDETMGDRLTAQGVESITIEVVEP